MSIAQVRIIGRRGGAARIVKLARQAGNAAALIALLGAGCAGPRVGQPPPACPTTATTAATPAIAATAAPAAKAAFAAQDRAAVEKVLTDQAAAWNRGDLDAYMAGYLRSPNLVFTSGSKVRTGYDETVASYRKHYGSDRASMGTLAFQILRVDPVGDGAAIVLGRWDLQRTSGASGGVFSVILERTAQGWLIVHDHTSSDPAKP
jgi:ketosteroid isomerase-like protein